MRMRRFAPVVLAAMFMLGCGAGALVKPPHVDPTEEWIQAGKKVDFAVTQTKVMIQRAHGAVYMPDLYMRLAELYTDRARYAWLVAYERNKARGDDSKAVESPEARLLKNLAIGTYGRILREFPAYVRGDEALFLTGHEYRELGDFDKMKETYEKLIETYPNSSHRLEAYLTLGDHAFDASDLATAERYYRRILAAPLSPVHALARYKLAWVRVNQQDCRGAVALFETTLKEGLAGGDASHTALLSTQKDLNVMREALVDLAYCYPEVYPEKPPIPYFRDLATSAVDYLAAMRKLANRFAIKEMRPQAVKALREVLDGMPADEDGPELIRRLHEAVVKGSVFDDPAQDVGRIVSVLDTRLGDYKIEPAVRTRLADEFELYARDIATRADVLAKQSQSTAALSQVADSYRVYLTRFGNVPASEEIRENCAEVLLAAKRYYDAGKAYETLEASTKKPDVRKQARLNAIAAYQQALENPQLGRLDRVVAWGGIRTLGHRVIGETPNDPAIVGIKLSIARSHYETGDYDTAAELFYALARQYPTTNEGVAAANLSLDALRLADNLEGLLTVGRRLMADTRFREDVRRDLTDIVNKAAQRQVAEVTASDSGDREEQLLAMAKRHKGSEIGEEAFYNSLLVARSNGEIERFYQLGDQFITDYPTSARRADVLSALASVASDSGDVVKSAKYQAASFAADPQAKDAIERLLAASSIHAVLGDPAAAGEIEKLAERGNSKVDDLLTLLARSGNVPLLEQVLAHSSINDPVANFFTGYVAFKHADYGTARTLFAKLSGATPELTRRANFLLGEITYAEFKTVGAKADIAGTIDANVKALASVERAYKPVIEGGEGRWAMLGVMRLSEANAKVAALLRGLELPANLSAADQKALKGALENQAAEVEKRANELKEVCVKQSKKGELFSEGSRSCLLDQALPDSINIYSQAHHGGADPQGAPPLRQALLKNSKDATALTKLAELYLGAGDVGAALLLLERAEQGGGRKAAVQNLLGLTLQQLNEPQEAGDAFKEAVSLEPGDPHLHLNLAAQYASYGYIDRAKAEVKKAGPVPAAPRGPSDHPDIGLLGQLGSEPKKAAP